MSDEKDVLSLSKAKIDSLPTGTVSVPPVCCPTCGCSNRGGIEQICPCECHGGKFFEEEVDVNDPKWTSYALYTEEDVIEEYVRSEGYLNFTYVCRKLKLKPADVLNAYWPSSRFTKMRTDTPNMHLLSISRPP